MPPRERPLLRHCKQFARLLLVQGTGGLFVNPGTIVHAVSSTHAIRISFVMARSQLPIASFALWNNDLGLLRGGMTQTHLRASATVENNCVG